MTPLGNIGAAGLKLLESLSGNPAFVWKGIPVPCTASTLRRGTSLAIGGFDVNVSLTLYVRKDQFLDVDSTLAIVDSNLVVIDAGKPKPVAGKTLQYGGKTYRILSAREPATQAHIELELGDSNR